MLTIASLVAVGLWSPLVPSVSVQEEEGQVLLVRGEKVYVRPGEVLENADVLIQDGRIIAVGEGLAAPDGAVEVAGKVVCAGFVDPWSGFGLDAGSRGDERTSNAA